MALTVYIEWNGAEASWSFAKPTANGLCPIAIRKVENDRPCVLPVSKRIFGAKQSFL